MSLTLDHVVIAVNDLEQAMADYRELGFTIIYGGRHASGATQNALICFKDGTYLELLAPTGESPKPDATDFSHLLQHGEGVVAYALASDDLEADAAALRERGIELSEIAEGGRKREDGIELCWKTALIDGSMSPFLIQDITPRNLRVPDDEATTTHVNKTQAISGIRILSAEELAGVTDYYTRLFGVMPEHTPMLKTSSFAIGKVLVLIYSTDEIAKSQQEQLEMAIRESFQSIEKFQALRQQYPQMDAAQAMYEWQSYFVKSLHSSFQTGAPKNEGICLPRYFVKSLHSNFQTVMSRLAATNGRAVQYGVTLRTTALLDEKNSHLYDLTKTHNVLIEIPIVRPRQSTDEQDDIQ